MLEVILGVNFALPIVIVFISLLLPTLSILFLKSRLLAKLNLPFPSFAVHFIDLRFSMVSFSFVNE